MKLKRVLYGTVALCAAVAVAGYAMISSLDVQRVAAFARAEVKSLTGRDLTIAGPVELRISLSPSVDLQDLSFANAPWGSRAEMLRIRRLEVEVALLPLLSGDIVVERLVVVDPDLLLERDAQGRGNWIFDDAAPAPGTLPADAMPGGRDAAAVSVPDVRDVRVEGGRVVLLDAASGETLELEITEAVGSVPSAGGTRGLRLAAAYNGNPFTVEGTYGGLPALLSEAPGPVDLTLGAGGAVVTVKGVAGNLAGAGAAELAVTAEGDSLADLAPFAGGALPPYGPYRLSSNISYGGQDIVLSGIVLKVGGSDLAGNADIGLAGPRPSVTASLVSKRLDLADFAAGGEAGENTGGSPGAPAADGRLFPDTPLPLEALRAADGRVKLAVDRLLVTPDLGLDNVAVTLVLDDGALTAEPLTAQLAGGSLGGRLALSADGESPQATVSLQGKAIDFGILLRQAKLSDEVGGKLDLDLDVTGQGASPHAIASGLNGHAQAVSQEGTIDNKLLSILSAGLGDVLGPLFGQSGQTRLECLVAHFDISDGQAASRALVLDSGAFAVAGRGGVDLAAERLNLAFDTETSQPSLASLAIPFRVTGPIMAPKVTPDPLGAAVGVVGTVGDVAKTGGDLVGSTVNAVSGMIGSGPVIGKTGGGQSLCGQALAAIGEGGGAATAAPASGGAENVLDSVGDTVKGVGQDIEKGIKSLFGN
jgi:AsmA family protein